MISDNKEQLQLFGVEEGGLGTHSCRKGVAMMVAAGCTVFPPIVSICIQAGWVMGGVKDRYFKRESTGDQYVGRCAADIDQLSKLFAISPPYFDVTSMEEEIGWACAKKGIEEWLAAQIIDEGELSASSKQIVWTCFALICYHQDYLLRTLHEECSFRASIFLKDIPDEFIDVVRVAFTWNATKETLKLTGVPHHVILMAEMEQLRQRFDTLQATMKEDLNAALDERRTGGSEYHTNNILNAIADSERRMLSTLELPTASSGNPEEYTLAIQNEDREVENIFNGITPDELTNGGQVQDVSRALVCQ